ncbi:hypothetical protein SJAG_01965 [Schizosaccharomyces japonicus yFS275]|uniref:Uncharacterized protein n=1 Tax=Schizosaccharomyces japonicus (strain yFS275 / FY16936) TaxID=402676 RepID=B6JZD4_SCHJY|nr:hypothetical protein SJAG_01965 [Schizosaccharomyces japonicus yFS275]EEB06902.1 hypothetical protein SJAG_01965 [Schizosaccharomyces japonicus yFS275]
MLPGFFRHLLVLVLALQASASASFRVDQESKVKCADQSASEDSLASIQVDITGLMRSDYAVIVYKNTSESPVKYNSDVNYGTYQVTENADKVLLNQVYDPLDNISIRGWTVPVSSSGQYCIGTRNTKQSDRKYYIDVTINDNSTVNETTINYMSAASGMRPSVFIALAVALFSVVAVQC